MSEPIEYGVKRYRATVPVSGDVPKLTLADALTPEALARYRQREAARAEALAAAREQLTAITDPVARAVLDLHAPDDFGDCMGDDMEGYEAEAPTWPCRTVEAVAGHYGIRLKAP